MLDVIKTRIEKMDKSHHIEILKILKQDNSITLNENKSGVYVNLSFLPPAMIQHIQDYINYIDQQEASIGAIEKEKTFIKNNYFS